MTERAGLGMSGKKGPNAVAGASGADQDAAGQQLDLFKSQAAAPSSPDKTGKRRVTTRNNGEAPRSRSDDAAEIARLAALPLLQYARERKPAATRLGCPVGLIDRLVDDARGAHGVLGTGGDGSRKMGDGNGGGAGRGLGFDDIEPWPDPVDGGSLLDEIAQTIRRHLVVDDAPTDAIALWVLHTHALGVAKITPRLAITSPERQCGKTTLIDLLSVLVARPLPTANITTAALFRTIAAVQPTLLIDEADTFIDGNNDMRGIINAGHSRATAVVIRSAPDSRDGWEPRGFDVWGAIALAAIRGLPGTIEDRSVKIPLRRRRPDEPIEQFRNDRRDRYAPLARQAARWADDNNDILSEADPGMPSELHNRRADNWRPLLAIADAAGGEWPERARRAAVALTRVNDEEIEAPGIVLLDDLRALFQPHNVLFTHEILMALHAHEDRPWSEYQRGRPITPPQLAALLKPYGIPRNKTVRRGGATGKGYRAVDFADAWARYLPAP
jgi:putative DNA primase/helicase